MDDALVMGQRARMIRRRRGLSQDVVAGLAGISKSYLSALERGLRGFNRRGLVDDLAAALGCSVADLTGQPYLPADLPARPLAELAALAQRADAHCDETRYALAGRDFGAVLGELHVHAATGDSDTRRVALAALVEACIAASGTVRDLGHGALAVAVARRGYDAAEQLGDPALMGFTSVRRAGGLIRLGARHRAAADVPRLAAVLASADRRSWLHFDIARGWAQAGGDRDAEAIRYLDAADRIAPTRIRNDPIARDLVLTLDRRARRRTWELDSLRNRFGISAHGSQSVNN